MTTKNSSIPDAIERSLASILAYNGARDLSSIISTIDNNCSSVAEKVGNALTEECGIKDISVITCQYRGTVLSGERPFAPIYSNPKTWKSVQENRLLALYWKVYDLGSTISELFEEHIAATQFAKSSDDGTNSPTRWHILAFAVLRNESRPTFRLANEENDVKAYELMIPHKWIENLLPARLADEISRYVTRDTAEKGDCSYQDARRIRNDALLDSIESEQFMANIQEDSEFQNIKRQLTLRLKITTADLLWEARQPESKVNKTIRDFIELGSSSSLTANTPLEEGQLSRFLQAVQLMGLYWCRHEMKDQEQCGLSNNAWFPLITCIPRPNDKNRSQMLQPHLGFSILWNCQFNEECLNTVMQMLPPWTIVLDKAAAAIDGNAGKSVTNAKEKLGYLVTNQSNFAKEVVDSMSNLHPGGAKAAGLFLIRLVPVLKELQRLAPRFVHEGQRFGVTVLVGLPYHRQVIGQSLAKVDQFVQELREMVPSECDDDDLNSRPDFEFLEPLILSSYSLLDWHGVVLFADYLVDPGHAVRLSEIIQLPPHLRALATTQMLMQTTKSYRGLFAINVDHAGVIKTFFGGRPLLVHDRQLWSSASAKDEVLKLFVKKLGETGIIIPENRQRVLDSFVEVLLRISDEPGHGALFVISKSQRVINRLSEISVPPSDLWKHILPFDCDGASFGKDKDMLYRLAIMDGATAVLLEKSESATDYSESWRKAKIFPRKLITEQFNKKKFYDGHWIRGSWAKWTECLHYGAKRSSALALAMRFPEEVLVIAISSDGPVYFMIGGTDPVERWPS